MTDSNTVRMRSQRIADIQLEPIRSIDGEELILRLIVLKDSSTGTHSVEVWRLDNFLLELAYPMTGTKEESVESIWVLDKYLTDHTSTIGATNEEKALDSALDVISKRLTAETE